MGSKRKNFPLTKKELNALFRDPLLIGSIVQVVSIAFSEQTSPDCNQKARDFARLWLDSLAREHLWLLLLVLKGAVRSRKLKPGAVKKLLMSDRLSFPVSLDVPMSGDSDRTILDVVPSSVDVCERVASDCDQEYLRASIRRYMTGDFFSTDERRFVNRMLDDDLNLSDMLEGGFTVTKKSRKGDLVEKRLSPERIRLMYAGIRRKFRQCPELREVWEQQ